jgi:protocatechuate 4,5-dioxygenase, alpha chain
MDDYENVWCKVTCPERLSVSGPAALNGEQSAYRDADQSRKGYWLNQFCMSLMKAENRARFKANERAYLDEWKMTEEQKQAVLDRDLNRMMALGGNIYFLSKIGATDGKSFQQMAGSMTGMTEQEYRDMMVSGGRKIEGNRRIGEGGDAQRPPKD